MLEFWFNPNTPMIRKILFFFMVLAIAVALYFYQPLPLATVLMFAATGIVFLICRAFKLYFSPQHLHPLITRTLSWTPIALLIAVLFSQALPHLLLWGVQGISIMVLTVFIFSPYALYTSQHENKR